MAVNNAPTAAMKEWGYGEGYRYPQKRATPPPAGWTPQPTALATDPLPDPNDAPSPSPTLAAP